MRRLLCLSVAGASACAAAPEAIPTRPVHTFSIVARDPSTGELGVAVQSHWFSVGPIVPWAEAGVGAIATQSFVNVSFGPRGLEMLREGRSASEVVEALVESDPGAPVRQLAVVDAKGRVAAHTGERCIEWAGHAVGGGFGAQANMMVGEGVVPAMTAAFEAAEGPLAERLVAALEAGQAAGGDLRGRQSAALLVVRGASTGRPWEDRLVDLRVEDDPEPIAELARLLRLHRAYEHMNAGDAAMEEGAMERALEEYARAAELAPDVVEIRFWNAFTLATNGELERSLPIFREVFAAEERWIELLGRLPAAGLVDRATVDAILAGAGGR